MSVRRQPLSKSPGLIRDCMDSRVDAVHSLEQGAIRRMVSEKTSAARNIVMLDRLVAQPGRCEALAPMLSWVRICSCCSELNSPRRLGTLLAAYLA